MIDDLPSDLARLETLRTWHEMWLTRIDQKMAWVRRAEEERRRAEERRVAESPDWLIERGLNRDAAAVYVHVGGCRMTGKRCKGVDRGTALRALAQGVASCSHCRPDTELGFLEG